MRNNCPASFHKRSTLYDIEPIGIGTSMVESLTSYLIRISNAHNIKLNHLLKFVIFPLIKKRPRFMSNNSFSRYVDGGGLLSIDFMNALEALTPRTDLHYLTLIPWQGISINKNISTYKKWCTQCLNKMKKDNIPSYHPLLWNILNVNVCPIHNTALTYKCPVCNENQLASINKWRNTHCYKCDAWLGEKSNIKINEVNLINEFDVWLAKSVGELLEVAPNILCFPTRHFASNLIRDLEANSTDLTGLLDQLLLLGANKENYKSEIAKSLLYRLSSLSPSRYDENKDYFEILMKLIFYIGAPIRIVYDYNCINLSLLPIFKDLDYVRKRAIRQKKLIRDFEYLIYNFHPLPTPEEIIRITGDSDDLLISYLESYLNDNNKFLQLYNTNKSIQK